MEKSIIDRETFSSHLWGILSPEIRIEGLFSFLDSREVVESFFDVKEDSSYQVLFGNTAYDTLVQASPCLFETKPETPLFSLFFNLNSEWGMWGTTAADQKSTAAHWRSLLNVFLPDGSISHLRFYSSAVFKTLASACSPSELDGLMGPYHTLFVACGNGELQVINRQTLADLPPAMIANAYSPRREPWWHMTDVHLEAFRPTLDRVFRDNIVLWLWAEYFEGALFAHEVWGELEQFVDWALQDGQHEGLRSSDELSRHVAAVLPFVDSAKPAPFIQKPHLGNKESEARLVELEAAANSKRIQNER